MNTDSLTTTERRAAAHAWETGGHLMLGLWLSKARPHFGVAQYAAAVKAAREELGDDTDYSQDTRAQAAALAQQRAGEAVRAVEEAMDA